MKQRSKQDALARAEEQAEEQADKEDVLARGAHPRYSDLDRVAIIGEARKNTQALSLLGARLLVALEDAHRRLEKLEK